MTDRPIVVLVADLPPSVRSVLCEVGYHKKDLSLRAAETVSVRGYASDGCRSYFAVLSLDGQTASQVSYGSWGGSNPFESRQADLDEKQHAIPLGAAVLTGEVGYRVSATLTVNPANMAPLLPVNTDCTARQISILAIIRGLKSSYRKEAYERLDGGPPTQEEFDRLVELLYITRNRAGAIAITTDGKNACRSDRSAY